MSLEDGLEGSKSSKPLKIKTFLRFGLAHVLSSVSIIGRFPLENAGFLRRCPHDSAPLCRPFTGPVGPMEWSRGLEKPGPDFRVEVEPNKDLRPEGSGSSHPPANPDDRNRPAAGMLF